MISKRIYLRYTLCTAIKYLSNISHVSINGNYVIGILPDNMMHLAVQKFKLILKNNKWNAPL